MYGAIPDVVITKPPRNNQFRVVVALVVGVMIGALGTIGLMAGGPEAPSPSRAAMELDAQSHCGSEVVSCCKKADHALAMCARLPCFPGTCNMDKNIC